MGIRAQCITKINLIKEYIFLKIKIKGKGYILWFDPFLLAIIKHYISPDREFNKEFKHLNQKFLRQSQAKLWSFY